MKISGASLITDYLTRCQTKYVFFVPGRLVYPLVRSIAHSQDLQGIMATSELNSGYMADGYARASGKMGVCLSTGGPGASNLLTAAVNARLEGSKVLFLTGDVPSAARGLGSFHDSSAAGTRSVELFQAAVDYSSDIDHPDDLLDRLDTAASESPAHLAIGTDIQTHLYDVDALATHQSRRRKPERNYHSAPESLAARFDESIARGSKIILLVGSQVIKDGRASELLDFVEKYQLPVATTLSAKGAIPETHPLSLGTFGSGGTHRAHCALLGGDLDTLLLVGLDFSQNESLDWDARLYSHCQTIRIDRLARKFPHTVKIDWELRVPDCVEFLHQLSRQSPQQLPALHRGIAERSNWVARLQAIPWHWPSAPDVEEGCVPVDRLIRSLQRRLPDETILCADAGTTRRCAGQNWISSSPQSFFSASKLAPMGWAISAGIGIQLARPKQRVVVLTGDGSMMMHGMEIVTAVRYRLPILFVISNNRGYADIYQRFQTDEETNQFGLLPAIDWVQFARSVGVEAIQVRSPVALERALDRVLATPQPFVLEVSTPLTSATPTVVSSQLQAIG